MASNRELFLKVLGQTSETPYLLEIESAQGVFLKDLSGTEYLDLISGVSVSNLGHNNPEIVKAVCAQAADYMHLMVYGEYVLGPQVKLAEMLCSVLPEKLNSVYFVNSGSEAVEGAVKLARRYTGRNRVMSFKNAYHGSSAGALSLCGNEDFKNSFRPLVPGIHLAELNSFEELINIDSETACVILEPIQAEAGVMETDTQFMKALRSRCTETGCLLIFDEIQTGFGRTGKMFAMDHYGVVPDIVCFAKALGGGMPLGAFVAEKKVMNSFTSNPVLGHITTFGGHPVSCAAALASLQIITAGQLWINANTSEKIFRQLLSHKLIKTIRGKGLLLAVELQSVEVTMQFVRAALTQGLITDWFIFHPTAFRIAPPLNITRDEIQLACAKILKTLNSINL
ncbi:MAG TPA: aspartate aminotransferase family protein [Bacteroidales bacterium]|nr:aspartate aminotransferase family protein [Bacteroidales bacterium]HQP04338.1 aspartate aminotransferase family protein [Bacteroidales bacterium]